MEQGTTAEGAASTTARALDRPPAGPFQSITHMAPACRAYSLLLSVFNAGPVLPLAVLLALVACSRGQLDRPARARDPSAGGPLHVLRATLAAAGSTWHGSSCSPSRSSVVPLPRGRWAIREYGDEVGWP